MFKEFAKWSDVVIIYLGVLLCWLYALDGQQGVTFVVGFLSIMNFFNTINDRITSARMDLMQDYIDLIAKRLMEKYHD